MDKPFPLKTRRAREREFLRRAKKAVGPGWIELSEEHWYRFIGEHCMDYFPGLNRVAFRGRVFNVGPESVESFVKNRTRDVFTNVEEYYMPDQMYELHREVYDIVREWVIKRDEHTCHYCGVELSDGDGLTVDHVVPRIVGGLTVPSNLVTACKPCNKEKDATSYEDFTGLVWDPSQSWKGPIHVRPPSR